MGYPFFVNLVYSNLNFVLNILHVIMTKYRFWPTKALNVEIKPCDFVKIFLGLWPYEVHFLICFFHIRKTGRVLNNAFVVI